MLNDILTKAGLSEAEARVYLASLELGETTVSRIAIKSGIKRTTAYLVIGALKEKGLMHEVKKHKRNYFYADDPRRIAEQLQESLQQVEGAMPSLLAIANFIDKKPGVKFFEGTEGVKALFKDMLQYSKSEILEWYSESFATEFDENFFYSYFSPRRIKNKISARAILPDNEIIRKLTANNTTQLRRTKLIDPKKYHIKIEINIYGRNKVSIISFSEKIGLLIESQLIHDSLKNIFELMWNAEF